MKHVRTIAIAVVVILALLYGAIISAALPKTNIPVLSHDISSGTKIVAADVTTISWPANGTVGIITSSDAIVGRVTAISINAGEPLTASEFVGAQSSGQPIGHFPWANAADAGKLPIPFPVTPNQLGGTIASGDYVDIVVGYPESSQIIIQRVHVLEADDVRGVPIIPNTNTAGTLGVIPTKLVVALAPDQYPALFPKTINLADLRFLYVTVDAPCIPGIPAGVVGADNCVAAIPVTQTQSATPTAAPTPSPSPSGTATSAPSASPR